MRKTEYQKLVRETASTFLVECKAAEWKKENEEGNFHDFFDYAEYDGGFHSIIDSQFTNVDWQEAAEYIQCSNQNPDDVDRSLYIEGCNWKMILIRIAFEVFSWDVQEKAEEMFNKGKFGKVVKPFPTNKWQLGFYPDHKLYEIPKGPWAIRLGGGGVKVYKQGTSGKLAELSVVFEGSVLEQPDRYVVACRRIYTQIGREDGDVNIRRDLGKCKEEFGCRALQKGGK